MVTALLHLAMVVAIPPMAAGLLISAGGPRVTGFFKQLLPAREDQ